jgi:TatA/E family protein of Tat protein translocase
MAFGIDDGVIILIIAVVIFFFGRNKVKEWAGTMGDAIGEFNKHKSGESLKEDSNAKTGKK